MKRRPFGPTNVTVPVIGQGTWWLERTPRRRAVAALRAGLDAGLTHIDTAEMYGDGEVEEIVGEAIAGRRDEAFLVSKVLPRNATFEGTLRACERSLRRLGTDYLDAYLIHWRDDAPVEEALHAFQRLRERGDIRAWGVSNYDVEDLMDAVAVVGEGEIACNQALYHLGERTIEHEVVPWCREHGIAVVAYSPFGSGAFPSSRSTGGRLLDRIAAAHQATARQVALAFLLRDDHVFAIPKAARLDHTRENAGGGDLELTDAEIAEIDAAFPVHVRRSLPMI